jgi:hypothetical protein
MMAKIRIQDLGINIPAHIFDSLVTAFGGGSKYLNSMSVQYYGSGSRIEKIRIQDITSRIRNTGKHKPDLESLLGCVGAWGRHGTMTKGLLASFRILGLRTTSSSPSSGTPST